MPHSTQLPLKNSQVDYNKFTSNNIFHISEYEHYDDTFNVEEDYIDLFSFKKKGHMTKYIHMYRPDIYDSVIQQDSFYPFRMECDLLVKKVDCIASSLLGITEVIEIGPGSKIPIISKTVPFLKSLQKKFCIDTYQAIDINVTYAQQACHLIQKYFPDITTNAIELDFLSKKPLNIVDNIHNGKRKLFFGFGQPIFANNTEEDTQKFLDKVSILLDKEDCLLFGIDTNNNEETLKKAYSTNLFYELLLNTMYYLKDNLNLIGFNPEAFDLVCKWDVKTNSVNLLLRPTYQQVIKIRNKELAIQTNQELHITSSRKPGIQQIKKFLDKSNLEIKNTISLENQKENTFFMVIVTKK